MGLTGLASYFQSWREWQLCAVTLVNLRGGQMTSHWAQLTHTIILNRRSACPPPPPLLWISYQVFKGKLLLPNFMECIYYHSLSQTPPILGEGIMLGDVNNTPLLTLTPQYISEVKVTCFFSSLKTRIFPKRIKQKDWSGLRGNNYTKRFLPWTAGVGVLFRKFQLT